ncbi:MAG: hypothetical protein HY975_01855 [Candidatus Kerfeldbacteria bacterium]|nr:hypothetical protein [Candidatus Kerfeldbacteria bacterium]
MSSHQRRRATHVPVARMPSVSEVYALIHQLGEQPEAVCTIPLPRPRFSSRDVSHWSSLLDDLSGICGVNFTTVVRSMNLEKRWIEVRVHVRRT